MRRFFDIVRHQYLGALALLIVLGGVAAAATGGNLKLGASNTADKKTMLQNTGAGPALQLTSKAGQPSLSVSNFVQVPKLNASLLGGKAASAFAVAASVYTKAQSDAKYAAAGSSYSKAQSDGKYALDGSSYTKAQSDAKYSLAGAAYTKAEGDDRYGHILQVIDFSGSSNPDGSSHVIHSSNIALPAAGVVTVMIWASSSTGDEPLLAPKLAGNLTNGIYDPGNNGGYVEGGAAFGSAGNVSFELALSDNNPSGTQTMSGKIIVVFYPF